MMANTFQTMAYSGNLTGDISAYHRIVNFTQTNFNLIKDSTLYWGDDQRYGYLGFQPYSSFYDSEFNFMYQLKKKGLITYNIISFDLRDEYGNTSYVKFGGFDTFAIKGNETYHMGLFKTRSLNTW